MASLRPMTPRPKDIDLGDIWLFSALSASQLRTLRRTVDEVEVPRARSSAKRAPSAGSSSSSSKARPRSAVTAASSPPSSRAATSESFPFSTAAPLEVHPLPDVLLHPHPRPAGPAAEALLPAPLHLDLLDPGNGVENLPGLVEHPVVPSQVAGVVVGHLGVQAPRRQLPRLDQMAQQHRVVDHLEIPTQVGVLP